MKSNSKMFVRAVAAAVLCSLPFQAHAEAWSKNWEFSVPVTSRQQAEGLKPGTKLAMSCVKCKTVQVMDVVQKGEFLAWFNPKTKHVCPGCGGHWGYVVYGKGSRHGDFVHTCSKCGSKSMFCCSTHAREKTKGM